ncbi:hypothetical protein IQ22_03038 [Pseudomonas duriflava]|uniref:Uncharacterized protein n=1 Tax=Pseudomonas duriflava TaxID=459528 RepID=A0A562Q8U4_9PSED|nr:hypothetical protein [Pseudomonas duriflava]TWI53191.1 hypothetical protein IQ22_03038 [Pseudomonas duriflava]
MNTILITAVQIIAKLAALFSLLVLPLYLMWCLAALDFLLGRSPPLQEALVALVPASTQLLWKAVQLLQLAGGLLGWGALFAMYRRQPSPFSQVPLWIKCGLASGIAAALLFKNIYIIPPLVLTVTLVFLSVVTSPSNILEPTR